MPNIPETDNEFVNSDDPMMGFDDAIAGADPDSLHPDYRKGFREGLVQLIRDARERLARFDSDPAD